MCWRIGIGVMVGLVANGHLLVPAQGASAEGRQLALDLRSSERIITRALKDNDRQTLGSERMNLSRLVGRAGNITEGDGACSSAASALYNVALDFTSSSGPLGTSVSRNIGNFERWMPRCEKAVGVQPARRGR